MRAVATPHSLSLEGKGQDRVGGWSRESLEDATCCWEKQTNEHLPAPCTEHHHRMEIRISIIDYNSEYSLWCNSSVLFLQQLKEGRSRMTCPFFVWVECVHFLEFTILIILQKKTLPFIIFTSYCMRVFFSLLVIVFSFLIIKINGKFALPF